jgi:benzoyl-CoA reductase subunit B
MSAKPAAQLAATQAAREFSRGWFQDLRRAVIEDRKPYVLSNAEMPHEIFETLGLPVVTGEWWGGMISAKQRAGDYLDAINARGFHKGLGAYNTLGLLSTITEIEAPPWGGLPPPAMIASSHREQSAETINTMVAERLGVPYFGIEMPAAGRFHVRWWEEIRSNWEALYETDRIDLLAAQYREMIGVAESVSGRRFDEDALCLRLETVNAQEEKFDEARNLILAAKRCPVAIPEQMSNTMTAQWHRGSAWALGHARAFRDEIAERVQRDEGVVADERCRLMWAGVGLWQNTGFYRAFENSHGAVFVWSIYLALAADAYIKYGLDDPVRALAARYLHVGELAHAPPWAGAWMVHEARRGRIDGCVMLTSPGQRHQVAGNNFQIKALEEAGIPVLEIVADPNDNRSWDEAAMRAKVSHFIEERLNK